MPRKRKPNKYKIDGDTLILYNNKDNRELLFDVEDFDFVNRHTWCIKPGNNNEYAVTTIKQISGNYKLKSAHRLLMNEPVDMIDHINNNGLDNRKLNLRIANNNINMHNRPNAKGYFINKRNKNKKYEASIRVNKKLIRLGCYKTEAEARAAYLKAKQIYHPSAPTHLWQQL